MMCELQSLHFSDDGYVVRCKQCGHFQIAFISTILTLTEQDFQLLCSVVRNKYREEDCCPNENVKCIIIPTPCQGIRLILTQKDAKELRHMLEEADSEYKALLLIGLFNQ